MTESEWLACRDPTPMLRYLELGGRATCRQLRLFGVACCRRIWGHFSHAVSRVSVETAERYADGLADDEELRTAHQRSAEMLPNRVFGRGRSEEVSAASSAAVAADWVSAGDDRYRTDKEFNKLVPGAYAAAAAGYIAGAAADAAFFATFKGDRAEIVFRQRKVEGLPTVADHIWATEEETQSAILRDVVGNPFRPGPVDSGFFLWNGGTIPTLARAVYDERELPSGHLDRVRLLLLADMLEDAGCTDTTILDHLRGPGPHVRGCWVVDLLLGKS